MLWVQHRFHLHACGEGGHQEDTLECHSGGGNQISKCVNQALY